VDARFRRLSESKFVRDTAALQLGKMAAVGLSTLSAFVALRALGPSEYGIYALAQSFLGLWMTLDLTGIGISTSTHLGLAVGRGDTEQVLDLMAVYLRVQTILGMVFLVLLLLVGQPAAMLVHGTQEGIGLLATLLALNIIPDAYYNLVLLSLQSRRQMGTLAIFQTTNQVILTLCVLAAAVFRPTAEGLVLGRIVYSYSTCALALLAYAQLRGRGEVVFPSYRLALCQALHVPIKDHLRIGFLNAVDKNIANTFTQIPQQMVGALAGPTAAGYLSLALTALNRLGVLTSAIFDNMQAVVPQMIGRQEYARLQQVLGRVIVVLAVVALLVYGALAVAAHPLIPILLGSEWIPAIPAVLALALFGMVSSIGGVLGPLYRALQALRGVIVGKITALVTVLPLGWLLISTWGSSGYADIGVDSAAALAGAWTIVALYVVSVGLTAWVGLRALHTQVLAAGKESL
jgi:O-antigen/teichoic acid export membrane protein